MKCDYCNQDLRVSKVKPESDIDSTDVYIIHTLVCVNPDCVMYAGTNLSNPLKVSKVLKTKVS